MAEISFLNMLRDERFIAPAIGPYVLLVISNDVSITKDDIDRFSSSIIESEVKCVLAWGKECSLWDDMIDWCVLEKYDYKIPEDKNIVTTWHDDESLDDVIQFAITNADYIYECESLVILNIGSDLIPIAEINRLIVKNMEPTE